MMQMARQQYEAWQKKMQATVVEGSAGGGQRGREDGWG